MNVVLVCYPIFIDVLMNSSSVIVLYSLPNKWSIKKHWMGSVIPLNWSYPLQLFLLQITHSYGFLPLTKQKIPNMYDFLFSVELKRRYFEECLCCSFPFNVRIYLPRKPSVLE